MLQRCFEMYLFIYLFTGRGLDLQGHCLQPFPTALNSVTNWSIPEGSEESNMSVTLH